MLDKQIVNKETLFLIFKIKNRIQNQKEDFSIDTIEVSDEREESLLRWLVRSAQFWIS